jgi:hypothetical protein
MREKFMELARTVDEERAAELLRMEDLEMEEAAGSRYTGAQVQSNDYAFDEPGMT